MSWFQVAILTFLLILNCVVLSTLAYAVRKYGRAVDHAMAEKENQSEIQIALHEIQAAQLRLEQLAESSKLPKDEDNEKFKRLSKTLEKSRESINRWVDDNELDPTASSDHCSYAEKKT